MAARAAALRNRAARGTAYCEVNRCGAYLTAILTAAVASTD